MIWAGIFPWRMVDGFPTETAPHVIGAVMVFTATGLGLIIFSRRMIADPRWRDLTTYTMLTGVAVVLALRLRSGRREIYRSRELTPR